ncbi:hypothetical protein HDU76_004687, partial [Blyttiomyces sp. JEL0837]
MIRQRTPAMFNILITTALIILIGARSTNAYPTSRKQQQESPILHRTLYILDLGKLDDMELSAIEDQHRTFKQFLNSQDIGVHVVNGYPAFKHLMSGMVIDITSDKSKDIASWLASLPGVKKLVPVTHVRQPKVIVHQTEATTPIPTFAKSRTFRRDTAANNITGVYNLKTNNMGAGIVACTVDTGVDYTHPALGQCFGHGCKVAFGYDFVGDAYDSSSPLFNIPEPSDNPPMDCAGHGTHVAGIIAAQDVEKRGAEGVAPKATLGAYRVFGCNGSTDTAIIVAALEQAYIDGCVVINI